MVDGTDDFFEEQTEASEVKANIISTYFFVWAKIVGPAAKKRGKKIAYIDLFAGPGRYRSGAISTPVMLLEKAIADKEIASSLVTWFNDNDEDNVAALHTEINNIADISLLANKPIITNRDVDDELAKYFNSIEMFPTFSFIDPFGYRGLSLKLIKGVIKNWGCDCVFFFNYRRINMGLQNPAVQTHMEDLFGTARASALREKLPALSPLMREALILEELVAEIKSIGGKFVLPFTFKNHTGKRSKHMLIFVSKHFIGYNTMKGIMASKSTAENDGIATFEYSPADISTPFLFSLSKGTKDIGDLKNYLLSKMIDRFETFSDFYERTSFDTPYLEKNYRKGLIDLHESGQIETDRLRRRGTFPKDLKFLRKQ